MEAFWSLLGVIIGALIPYILNKKGSIKIFINKNVKTHRGFDENGYYIEVVDIRDQNYDRTDFSIEIDIVNTKSIHQYLREVKLRIIGKDFYKEDYLFSEDKNYKNHIIIEPNSLVKCNLSYHFEFDSNIDVNDLKYYIIYLDYNNKLKEKWIQ